MLAFSNSSGLKSIFEKVSYSSRISLQVIGLAEATRQHFQIPLAPQCLVSLGGKTCLELFRCVTLSKLVLYQHETHECSWNFQIETYPDIDCRGENRRRNQTTWNPQKIRRNSIILQKWKMAGLDTWKRLDKHAGKSLANFFLTEKILNLTLSKTVI